MAILPCLDATPFASQPTISKAYARAPANITLGLLAPYLDETIRPSAVVVLLDDIEIKRNDGNPKLFKGRRTQAQKDARRGQIRGMSKKSRHGLSRAVRNTLGLKNHVVLTYSKPFPRDGKIAKKHLRSFLKWVTGKGGGAIWKQEFHRSGEIHFHLVTNIDLQVQEVLKVWAKVSGCWASENLIRIKEMRNQRGLASYLTKSPDHYSNLPPDTFCNPGRWWGYSGHIRIAEPICGVVAPEGTAAKIRRQVNKVHKAKQKAKGFQSRPRRDNGLTNMTTYGAGGFDVAQAVQRYGEFLGCLAISKPV